MRCIKTIRAAKLGYIILSVIICALGILMITRSIDSAQLIHTLIGILLILFGIVRIIGYISKDLYRLAFQHDLALGILYIVLGVIIMFKPHLALNVLSIMLGLEISMDGLLRVQTALDARRFGLTAWWLILLMAILACASGIVLMVCPRGGRLLLQWLGIALLTEGFLSLCVVLCAVGGDMRRQSDFLEA